MHDPIEIPYRPQISVPIEKAIDQRLLHTIYPQMRVYDRAARKLLKPDLQIVILGHRHRILKFEDQIVQTTGRARVLSLFNWRGRAR